jgi:Ca2+-binding EF-hand superfamily protein
MKFPIQFHRLLFSGAILSLLAACQSTPTQQPNRFDRADTDHNGCLSRAEISDMIVTDLFNARNTSQDGRLTREQWVVPGDDAANKVFSKADANHDGVVTLEEAKAYGRKIGVGKKMTTEADKNGDGCVDRAEVQAYYASKEGPAR